MSRDSKEEDGLLNAFDEEIMSLMFVFWGIIIPIIAGFGLIGNMLTMIVLWKKEMRSNTVYFLRVMAITDTGIILTAILALSLIAITQRDKKFWLFKQVILPIIYTPVNYIAMTFQMINVWVTVVVAFERYVTICYPFNAKRIWKKKIALNILAVITAISILYNIPRIFAARVVACHEDVPDSSQTNDSSPLLLGFSLSKPTPFTIDNNTNVNATTISLSTSYTNESSNLMTATFDTVQPNKDRTLKNARRVCFRPVTTDFGKSSFFDKVYMKWMYTIIIYTIPLIVLSVLNALLMGELYRMNKKRKGTNIKESSEANMSRVLVIIVLVFILCQTPGLVAQFNLFTPKATVRYLCISNTLIVLNSSVNFLIYTTTGRRFRRILIRILKCMKENKLKRKTSSLKSTTTQTEFICETYEDVDVFDVGETTKLRCGTD